MGVGADGPRTPSLAVRATTGLAALPPTLPILPYSPTALQRPTATSASSTSVSRCVTALRTRVLQCTRRTVPATSVPVTTTGHRRL